MPDPGKKDITFRVSKTVSGKALDGTTASQIVLRQNDDKLTLHVTKDTKIEAERGADVKDSKRPFAADIKAGKNLRVLYHPDKNEAAEVMILKGAS